MIALHVQPITNGCILANFLLNQDYIKEFLCINKEEPELQCNGKCHLKKQLKNAQHEQQDNYPKLINLESEFIIDTTKTVTFSLKKYNHRKVPTYYSNMYSTTFTSNVFQPPQV